MTTLKFWVKRKCLFNNLHMMSIIAIIEKLGLFRISNGLNMLFVRI